MGKSSKKYSGGTVIVNGTPKVSTYKRKNNVYTTYNMSDAEKKAYDYAQNTFANNLKNLNVLDKNTQKNIDKEINAYTANGQKIINNMYTPMINNLKNDIASRFGNFDNSIFMDNLKSIETNRADAVSSLAQDVLAKRSELVNNEMAQRYTYMSFLQDIQNQTNSTIMNLAGLSQQNSSMGNNFNSQQSSSSFSNYANLASNLMTMFGTYGK